MRRMLAGAAFLTLQAVLFTPGCWAQTDTLQNKLGVDLEFLTHGEGCGGGLPRSEDGSVPVEDRSYFLYGRTRLTLDYERSCLQAHAVIQNSAVWGMSGNQKLSLYEAWVKLKARNGLFAQLGRMVLAYDDERIIGANDFAMASLSHDVLRVGYEGHGHQLHAILAYNQNGDEVYTGTYYNDGAQYYKTMQTVWYHYDVPSFPLGASLLFMNMGQQAGKYKDVDGTQVVDENNPPCTEYQQMYGGYFNFHPKYFTLEGAYYRQTGKIVDRSMQAFPIKAWMASVKLTVNPSDNYGFELGYDYLSGDDYIPLAYGGQKNAVRHPEEGGFTPLYGSRTKFYGMMDYYYENAYIHGFTPGLQNAFVGVFGKPMEKLDFSATYHYLAVATDLHGLDRTLGHCVDLQASYEFSKDVSFTVGYTQMTGSDTMDRLKQGSSSKHARWGWFSLVISPSIFTTKW